MTEDGLTVLLFSLIVGMFVVPLAIISVLKRVRARQSPSEINYNLPTNPKIDARQAEKQRREEWRARMRTRIAGNADQTLKFLTTQCVVRGLWITIGNVIPLVLFKALDTSKVPLVVTIVILFIGVGLGVALVIAGVMIGQRQLWALATARVVTVVYPLLTLGLIVAGFPVTSVMIWVGLLFDVLIFLSVNTIFSMGPEVLEFE